MKTPENITLTQSNPSAPADALLPDSDTTSTEYPKALYSKNSKAGALITKLVQSAEEEKAAGDEWVSSVADLKLDVPPGNEAQ